MACHVLRLTLRSVAPTVFHSKLSLPDITLDSRVFKHLCLWSSVDDASPVAVARQSFQRLATPGALSLTNVNGNTTVPPLPNTTVPPPWPATSPFRDLSSICHSPRANDIVRVDTEGLSGVTEIGSYFLRACHSLRVLNPRGLVNVTRIGHCFMRSCDALQAVELAPLSRVRAIGDLFMAGCASLTALDVAPLSRLATLPSGFLLDCSLLQSLDCRPLRSVTTIGDIVLVRCTALQDLNVSSFASVTQIGDCFLHECSALRNLDLSAMTVVAVLNGAAVLDDHQLKSLIRPQTDELATAAIGGF